MSEKERGIVWKDYVVRIMNKENDWDFNVEGDAVEGAVVCESREEVQQALVEMITEKAPGPSQVSLELIAASMGVGIQVMVEICRRVLDVLVMRVEWALSIVVSIFKGKGDIRNSSFYRAVKLLEYGIKLMERVLEKRLCIIVTVDEMQFGIMPERGTIDAVFIWRRQQEEYHAKGKKLYICFVDLEKDFHRVQRKVLEWVMRKKGIPEALIRSVMSLYEGVKTRVSGF